MHPPGKSPPFAKEIILFAVVSSTILTLTCKNTVNTFHLIVLRKGKMNRFRQTLNSLTLGTSKVKMMYRRFFIITLHANGKVLFSVLCHYSVKNSVFAKTVENPVYGCSIDIGFNILLNSIPAHCFSRFCKQFQYRCFSGCASSFSH